MILSSYDAVPEWVGKSIADIALEIHKDPADTYMYLIKLAQDKKRTRVSWAGRWLKSDIIARCNGLILISAKRWLCGGRHPRGVGSFPRVFNHYVKELHGFQHRVKPCTKWLLSAEHMGMLNRGKSRTTTNWPGHHRPDLITDRSTFKDPFALSEGIEGVWVNGKEYGKIRYIKTPPRVVIKTQDTSRCPWKIVPTFTVFVSSIHNEWQGIVMLYFGLF